MPFQPSPRPAPVLASVLAAGLMLTVASCSRLAPLGPAARPAPHQLRSPIVLQAMGVRNPTPAGGCPAGFTRLPAPGQGPGCYRPLGAPVTIASAAVSPGPAAGPASASGAPATAYGLLITLPAANRAELTAVSTRAYDSQGAIGISVAGETWALPMVREPMTTGQFEIVMASRAQLLQLQRLLTSSG
jgi:hypothetical protein